MCNMCMRQVQELAPAIETREPTEDASERTGKPTAYASERMGKPTADASERTPKPRAITLEQRGFKRPEPGGVTYQPDLLAVATQLSYRGYDLVKSGFAKFRRTNAYAVVTRTTQPMHAVVGILALCSYWVGTSSEDAGSVRLWKCLYVGGIAVHLGIQFWMTFISGIVLYFSLPRHEFGRVQEVLFPVYFSINGFVSFVTLLSYLKMQSFSRFHFTSWLQITLLLATVLIESSVRLCFVKPMLKMKHLKTQMEAAAQSGQEIGKLVLGDLANCPHYMKILRSFRAHHSKIAIGNMITFGCSLYSLMIVADSICKSELVVLDC